MSVNGDATTGPMRLGTAIVDMGTGLYSAIGILMALHERERSGHGQYLDMTLYDCGMALLHPQAANFFLNGKRPAGHRQSASQPGAVRQVPDPDLRHLHRAAATTGSSASCANSLAGRNWPTIRGSPTTASATSTVWR